MSELNLDTKKTRVNKRLLISFLTVIIGIVLLTVGAFFLSGLAFASLIFGSSLFIFGLLLGYEK